MIFQKFFELGSFFMSSCTLYELILALQASDSDQESNDGVGNSRKPAKRARAKSQPSKFDGYFMSDCPTTTSGYGFQSMLKKRSSGGMGC